MRNQKEQLELANLLEKRFNYTWGPEGGSDFLVAVVTSITHPWLDSLMTFCKEKDLTIYLRGSEGNIIIMIR